LPAKTAFTRGTVSAETKPPIKSPQESVFLEDLRNQLRSRVCVVADAVTIEPVSTSEFPANREKNREFFSSGPPLQMRASTSPETSGLLCQIPYSSEQGISNNEQGTVAAGSGIFAYLI
jgi:hypothetical protein